MEHVSGSHPKDAQTCFHASKLVAHPKQSQARDAALDLIGASHVLSEAAGLLERKRAIQSSRACPVLGGASALEAGLGILSAGLAFLGRFFARPTPSTKCFSDEFITYALYVSVLQYSGTLSLPALRGRLSG